MEERNKANKQKKTVLKRILKACNITEIASICVVTVALTMNLIFGICAQVRCEKIADDNGYQKANAEFYNEQVQEIESLRKEGKLSNDEAYERKISIPDLNKDEYMQTSENVSKEELQEYNDCKNAKYTVANAGIATAIGFGAIGVVSGLGAEVAVKLSRIEDEEGYSLNK